LLSKLLCPYFLFFCLFELSFTMTANGLRIGDGGAFEKRQPNISTNAQ
jgi:hypothetical protein